jgi:hypothetical protein
MMLLVLSLLLFSLIVGDAPQAQTDRLVISDFDGGTIETSSRLAVVVISDEQLGGTSDARLTLVHPGANATAGALRISFHVTADFAAPFAAIWAPFGAQGLPLDLSAYRGLRFYARSKEGSFLAGVGQFAGTPALYMARFEGTPDWTLVDLPFETFRRVSFTGAPAGDSPAFVPKNVLAFVLEAPSQLRGSLDVEIDQVELYR